MDSGISALSMVVNHRWPSIKVVDLYFAASGCFPFATPELLQLLTSDS